MPRIAIIILVFVGIALLITVGIFIFGKSVPSTKKTPAIVETPLGEAGLLVSEDSGNTWKSIEGSRNLTVFSFQFKVGSPAQFYAGTKGEGLWIYQDSKKTLEKVTDPKNILDPKADIYDLAQNSDGTTLYIAAFEQDRGRLLRLEQSGAVEIFETPLAKFGIFAVTVDPEDDNHLNITSGDGGFLESTDIGKTKSWEVVSRTREGIIRLALHPTKPGTFWGLGNAGTIYKTNSYGRIWVEKPRITIEGKDAGAIADIQYNPNRKSLMAASAYGLVESFDDGETWHALISPIPPQTQPVTAIGIHPRFREVFWMASGNQLYRTDDGGISWRLQMLPTQKTITLIRLDPSNTKKIYVGFSK